MPQEWIDPGVDLSGHMAQIKYPATREFVALLKDAGVRALHFEGPVLDDVLGGGVHYYNDVACFIGESDLERLHSSLLGAGYRAIRSHPDTATATDATADWVAPINGPYPPWSKEVKWPSDLWIGFGTTRRHWELVLVDLEQWFAPGVAETVTVLGDLVIERPPRWGLLLFCADRMAMKAMWHTAKQEHVELLRRLAAGVDWNVVGEKGEAYSREYAARGARARAILETMPSGNPDYAEPPPGNLFYHGLRCLEDYYPGTVPASVLSRLEPVASPRWLFANEDVEKGLYWTRDYEEYKGVAPFGIKEQLEEYGDLSGVELFTEELIPDYTRYSIRVATDASTSKLTEEQIAQIFAPLP
jgi:hypothetical protein